MKQSIILAVDDGATKTILTRDQLKLNKEESTR